MTDLILGPVIAAVDAVGRGAWDWWIVAGLVVAVLVAQVVAVVEDRAERRERNER